MGVNSLPKTVTRQRRDYDLNPGPSAPESSTLTTRLLSHPSHGYRRLKHSGPVLLLSSSSMVALLSVDSLIPSGFLAFKLRPPTNTAFCATNCRLGTKYSNSMTQDMSDQHRHVRGPAAPASEDHGVCEGL